MNKRILVVASHPDDEILGCGGTVSRLAGDGGEVYMLLLGHGVAARQNGEATESVREEIEFLEKCAHKANKAVGVKQVIFHDFPDNAFDSVPFLEIVRVVEKAKSEIQPAVIFTHYEKDLNIDHRLTYEAVITATRPLAGESVREIHSFEVLSSTEWKYPISFSPDTFFDISGTIKTKLNALECYKPELKDFPHPRSLEAVELNAKSWGVKVGMNYAEAFKAVRILR